MAEPQPRFCKWALGVCASALLGLLLIVWVQSERVKRAELELTATNARLNEAEKKITDASAQLAKSAADLGESAKRKRA